MIAALCTRTFVQRIRERLKVEGVECFSVRFEVRGTVSCITTASARDAGIRSENVILNTPCILILLRRWAVLIRRRLTGLYGRPSLRGSFDNTLED